ncbi:MAG: hypothetical protein ACD_2C00067G0004 [uncultured bacterium (gcode 4)]|uniref:Uncharacterized protein n=1 Tax=uncultured bacterium (gcode 4) TaxID=1234023 RepID=K2H2A1_9BACT|nr:MAG: hypothetical protein ACD_2C00067G0004 [uncultured bacterium (gcode 4)]
MMFDFADVVEYKYFYPDEIENFSNEAIVEKIFADNLSLKDELLQRFSILEWEDLRLMRVSLVELNLKIFQHHSWYLQEHWILVDRLIKDIDDEKSRALKEKEEAEKREELKDVEDIIF